jgi:hypothetical protein
MRKIQIKKERHPIRCEICHKADFFKPTLNYCDRCSTLILSRGKSIKDTNSLYFSQTIVWQNIDSYLLHKFKSILSLTTILVFIKIILSYEVEPMGEGGCSSYPPQISVDKTFYISFILIGIFILVCVFMNWLLPKFEFNKTRLKILAIIFSIFTLVVCYGLTLLLTWVNQAFILGLIVGGTCIVPTAFLWGAILQTNGNKITLILKERA